VCRKELHGCTPPSDLPSDSNGATTAGHQRDSGMISCLTAARDETRRQRRPLTRRSDRYSSHSLELRGTTVGDGEDHQPCCLACCIVAGSIIRETPGVAAFDQQLVIINI